MFKENEMLKLSDLKEKSKKDLKVLLVYPQYPNTF